jgi:four helix bundle protein
MRNHKDLHVWEKAHTLTLAVYKDTQQFPSEERFGLTSQIRRSCSSIPANLAGVVAGDGMERWLASSR